MPQVHNGSKVFFQVQNHVSGLFFNTSEKVFTAATGKVKNDLQTDEALWRLFRDITVAPGGQLTIAANRVGHILRRVKQQYSRESQSAAFKPAACGKHVYQLF